MRMQPSRQVRYSRRLIATDRDAAGYVTRRRDSSPEVAKLLDLASNDYLGLTQHPKVIASACRAARDWGTGAGASAAITGHSSLHAALCSELADLKRTSAALLFPTGYAANLAAVTAATTPESVIFCDRLAHASLLDGCRLSGCTTRFYRHRDLTHLQTLLDRYPDAPAVIISEGLFSMDGTFGPAADLLQLADARSATLIFDEAHSNGIYGEEGSGLLTGDDVTRGQRVLHVGTLSKSYAAQGGFIAGDHSLIEQALNVGRTGLFSTALAPPAVGAALTAVQLAGSDTTRRQTLERHARWLDAGLREQGWQLTSEAGSPILSILIGAAADATRLAVQLAERGLLVPAIRPPTVKPGQCRLRLSLQAELTDEDLERTLKAFAELDNPAHLSSSTRIS